MLDAQLLLPGALPSALLDTLSCALLDVLAYAFLRIVAGRGTTKLKNVAAGRLLHTLLLAAHIG